MAIFAFAMVIAAPPVTNMLDKLSFRKEVNGVMAQVREWKLLAVSKGRTITVDLDENILTTRLGEEEPEQTNFKEGISVIMEPNRVFFSPEGWATPATIEISSDKRSKTLLINPLTGQPRKI